ncbi:MAG: hypothetical protein R3264_07945, partial [Anaerolineae bacterium]|nr:hypothetical protein [Anaerolineae bacterium]
GRSRVASRKAARPRNKITRLIASLMILAGCADVAAPESILPTPTFALARFSTPTPAAQPTTATVTVIPTASATATSTATRQTVTQPPPSPTAEPTPTSTRSPPDTPRPTAPPPTATPLPTPGALTGRIAFPVDNGVGYYDVWVVELPDGAPFMVQPRARQPNFSGDGRLLVKSQGSDLGESIGLLDSSYTWQGIINHSPADSYPFWHPDGNRYTFSNDNLVLDPDTAHLAPFIFTACSLQIPLFETDEKCKDPRTWGKIVVGQAPVWTSDDRIVFFSYKGEDGLYFVRSASALREAGGLEAPQFLTAGNGLPTDTMADQVFFSAGDIDGNWEAYAINLDGSNLTNLSKSPASQDGLPAVSPDGSWVAFVSDRDGAWGIWVVPRLGGEPQKVVDLSPLNSAGNPWGINRRAWITERISWGP